MVEGRVPGSRARSNREGYNRSVPHFSGPRPSTLDPRPQMRIAYITAGAAGMYCGSCLHDNTLAAALLAMGEDVILVPTYTPLRTDEPNVSIDRVFFGGINV